MRWLIRILLGLGIFVLIVFGTYKLAISRTFQVAGEIVSQVDTDDKLIALTFDDGPTERTSEILEILDEHEVTATFYLVGESIEELPAYTRAIVTAGHELGNHSYSHERMVLKSTKFVADEIETTDALIRAAGYEGEITFRPPYGKKLFALPMYLGRTERTTVMWDIEPDSQADVAGDADAIANYVVDQAAPGSIILLHAMYNQADIDAIATIISELKAKGYEFVSISELLEAR